MHISPKQRWGIVIGGLIVIALISSTRSRLSNSTGSSGGMMGLNQAALTDSYSDTVSSEASYGMGVADKRIAMPQPPISPPGYDAGTSPELIPADRLIIKTATLSLVVDDVQTAIQSVVNYAAANGGFEVARNVYKNGLALNGSVTIRIPVKAFEVGLGEMKKIGTLEGQQVNGQDVTEEFVDVAAQLKNLQATEAQLLDIMKRATKIEDVLSVQRELTNVRSQIERLEGRKKYLEQSAALSTITVNVSTNPSQLPVVGEDTTVWHPLAVAKDALRGLIGVGISIANFLIQVAVYLPVWLVLAAVIWIGYRAYKRQNNRSL